MRIVHLGKYYPPAPGGIETFTRTLARAQADLGANVCVVVVNHTNESGRDITFEPAARTMDATDIDGRVQVLRVGRIARVANLDVAPGLRRLLRHVSRDPPDVWHLHTPNVTMALALAGMAGMKPLVVTHHSDIVRQRMLRHAITPLNRLIYGRAARIMPTSDAYVGGSPLLRRYKEKVTAVPLGLDLAQFTCPDPQALAYAQTARALFRGPIWLSVGRLIYYKAIDVALRALRHVPGTLVVVGIGPMEPVWRQLAAELGVEGRVVWKGQAPYHELVGLYHAAAALWFPSNARSEAYGLVQVEAMACGCPVVNTAVPHSGVPWVSRDGETGLTVPVNDPAALASAARRLLTEPSLRAKLSEEARRQAVGRFDHRRMAERTLEIYRAVAPFPERDTTGARPYGEC